MHAQIIMILTILLIFPVSQMALGETHQTNSEDYTIARENKDESSKTKIHEMILRWLNSENPQEFATQYDLAQKEGKIAVYIYLEDTKFESGIPSTIEVISSSKNIVRAFVAPHDLFELEKLDFVTKITPPETAQTPPIPKVDVPPDQPQEVLLDQPKEQENLDLWIVVPIVLIISAIIVITRRKRH